ncbi:hypothetical protein C8R46DRAFT_1147051 [Mycena filopes]|nr:hypothetical protein C8R46DRAFT_1147051 [Mycena filopes]
MTTIPCTNCGFIPGQHPLESAPANLHDLRRRLASLDATIAALTAERQKLQAASDAVVYPVLSLPTEIAAAILLCCCDPGVPSRPDPSKGPLLVTQICGEWREVATHTPEIWQSLEFTTDNERVELLDLWLARSGDAPLNLTLYSWDPARTEPFMAASILHAHHWQDVKFGLPLAAYLSLDLTSVSLPILRSISLDITHRPHDGATGTVAVTNAPLLHHVRINAHSEVKVDLRWSQITTLTLHAVDLTECISTLRRCPDLVKLTVFTIGDAPTQFDSSVVFSALETLECNLTNGSILEYLTLPRLHALVITQAVEPQDAMVLGNCLRRSACPLRVLSLSCRTMASSEILSAYLIAVSDCVLDLDLDGVHPGTLRAALTPMDILPRLQVLRVRGTHPSDDNYRNIIDTLHTRLRASPPRVALDEFTAEFSVRGASLLNPQFMPSAYTIAEFRALAATGLKIKVTLSGKQIDFNTHVIVDSWA